MERLDLTSARVLVTGAAGFIGSHLTETLLKKGCTVRAFVHYNSLNRWGWLETLDSSLKERLEVFAGDIRDPNGTRDAVKDTDLIFHLAALIGIPYSYHSPDTYLETNIRGTLNILQAARSQKVSKVIHTSTSEIYGTAQFVPITELHPVNPQSPYAATKAAADQMALAFYRSFGTPVTVIRPFNTYGPRQSARAIIPTIISQILSGATSLRLGALSPTRDLNFVLDTVNGFIAAAESPNGTGEVINLGSRTEISVGELAAKIMQLTGVRLEMNIETERVRPPLSEVERLVADNTKALRLLEWKPAYTLDEGLARTIAWFREPGHLALYKSSIYNV